MLELERVGSLGGIDEDRLFALMQRYLPVLPLAL